MAQRIVYLDDHDGSELEHSDPLTIQVGDLEWSADLSEKNKQTITDMVSEFLPDVPPVTARPSRVAPRTERVHRLAKVKDRPAISASHRASQRNDIIRWTKTLTDKEKADFPEGTRWEIGSRGRIDQTVVTEYYARHPDAEQLFQTSG